MMVPPPPRVLSYGIGVDSTALLVELHARGEAPDLVLSADTGNEKPETYEYLDVIRPWMRDRGIRFELVSYVPKRFKHWPPYYGILEMCLTNATLPSKSLGGSSCSLKYKKAPQDAFLKTWQPAIDAWDRGQRVVRLIGYDAGPRDTARANHALTIAAPGLALGSTTVRRPDRGRGSPGAPEIGMHPVHREQARRNPGPPAMVPAADRPGRGPCGTAVAHRRRLVAQVDQGSPRIDDRLHSQRGTPPCW